ncbi:MAG: TonB-dependent receptor [Gemmatimonadetes bacterium]|nr:TonB-dependent receptor [Gemmatimonadota bacterium]NIO32426.1 TonB-dependent receptor [Gemmatimonadota bacterium]
METHPLTISPPRRYTSQRLLGAVAALALVFGVQGHALAQQGTVTGRVIDVETGAPVEAVRVEVTTGLAGSAVASTSTDADGGFRFTGIASGSYSLVFTSDFYETKRVDGVDVSTGATSVGTVELTSIVFRLNPVVVTASRTQEKALDSPASVYTVESEEIQERTTTTAVDHMRSLPGADVVTTGLAQHNVVARGFNNVFSGALFVLTDNRWASVPSLRFNAYNLIPATNEDIDRIEFVLGPGSALYGPNVDKGVMHLITRSPLDHQGTTVSLYGGARSGNNTGGTEALGQVSFRHAGLVGDNVGYKLSGMYFNGTDFKYVDPAEQAVDAQRDYRQERFSGDLRFDFRLDDQSTLTVNGGVSRMVSSIEMTGIGAAQALDWTYSYAQARFNRGNLFAQAYLNMSDAGDSFTLRDNQLVTDNSMLWAAQLQHGTLLGERQRFTYGADLIRTTPRTEGIINGRNEDADNIWEVGGYLQSETELSPMFDLVLALRADYHDVVDDLLWSPRAAVVFKPAEGHSLRATYNRAFSQPSSNNLFLDKLSAPGLPVPGQPGVLLPYPVRGRGAPEGGFTFSENCMNSLGQEGLCMRSGFLPPEAGPLPVDPMAIWPFVVNLATQTDPDLGAALSLMNAPTAADVLVGLAALNPTTGSFDPVSGVQPVPQTKPMITNTFEAGYKGLIGDRLLIGIDVYYSKVEDFISPLLVETPNVFVDGTTLAAYLKSERDRLGLPLPDLVLDALADGASDVPWGIVTPNEVDPTIQTDLPPGAQWVDPSIQGFLDPSTIILTYRNIRDFDLWGADIGATFIATNWLSFTGSYSYVSENLFTAAEIDAPADLALNSPKNKGSVSTTYRSERLGLTVEARGRYVEGFPVKTGVYVSNDAVGQRCDLGDNVCVEDYALLDLNISYALPISRSTVVSLTGTNILNDRHIQMIGAPELASVWLLRVQQSF